MRLEHTEIPFSNAVSDFILDNGYSRYTRYIKHITITTSYLFYFVLSDVEIKRL